MALTTEQQTRINQLSTAKDAALSSYNTALQAYTNAWNASQSCQHARDQFTLGSKKNQACHIDTLSQLNAAANAAGIDRDTKKSVYDQAEKELADALKEIQDTNEAGIQALQTDPVFIQQQQAAKANSDEKMFAQKSTWYILGGVILIAITIAGIIIYKKYIKK